MEIEEFTRVIVPEREKLFRYAHRLLRNREEAEDAVQETLLRLWHLSAGSENWQKPAALAMTINKNLCLDKLRKKGQNRESFDPDMKDPSTCVLETLEHKESCQIVARCMEMLSPLQQMTLRMRDIEGYEIEEIVLITGSSAEAVRMNLSRARKRIRDLFFKYERHE
jgi:RNA polymerase sigma-70 factor (ECF subfamily)